ncbi:MAG: ABC-2 family transporter protein [DPANN group archaeon]|nr:ABC-2 family transporter protein [DPANN group archaeon]
MKTAKLWLKFTSIDLQREMAYRWNFMIKLFSDTLFGLFGPVIAYLIYSNSNGLPGWSFEQLLLFQGIALITFGISNTIFGRFAEHTIDDIRWGKFDVKLMRPAKPLLYQLATSARPDAFGSVMAGIAITAYAFSKLGLALTAGNGMAAAITIFMAVLFLFSLEILVAALAFLVIKSYVLMELFYALLGVGDYPISIYGGLGTFVFTFVFPVGLAAFYPTQALFGILSLAGAAKIALAGLAFFAFSAGLWNLGIKQYKSAGG